MSKMMFTMVNAMICLHHINHCKHHLVTYCTLQYILLSSFHYKCDPLKVQITLLC